jgi:hypothetical protein
VRGVAGYALTADKTVMYGGNSLKNFRDWISVSHAQLSTQFLKENHQHLNIGDFYAVTWHFQNK